MALAAMPAAAGAQHSKLSLESIGPAGGNGNLPAEVVGARDANKRVYLSTAEPLTSGDTDASIDLYSRTGGNTTLLSTGTGGGNGAAAANFGRAVQAGTKVIFQTDESLAASDTDSALDVYVHDGATTTLVSTGPGGDANGSFDSYYAGASSDGSRVFFTTRGALVGADTDTSLDVYERASATTTLISTGPNGGNGDKHADLAGLSEDGTKAFIHTSEPLVASDTDIVQDVYQRAGGTTTMLSIGPNGGVGAPPATYSGSSLDGSKVFFRTAESLLASDTDAGPDVYERANATTTTIHSISPSGGQSGAAATFVGASEDGSKVFVTSAEKLIAAPVDRDSMNDVYMSSGGTLTQISAGGNDVIATNAYLTGTSADGTRVFIRSEEALVAGDTDNYQDIYEYSTASGTLTRLSLGPAGGNGAAASFFGGASDDGTRVFLTTAEPLTTEDTDASADVYERHSGSTYLVSAGASGGNGAFDVSFHAVSPDGQRAIFRTSESLLTADSDATADVYSANVPGTVTVQLDAVPDDPQDFTFQAFGLDDGFGFSPPGFGPTDFTLDDDANATLPNQQVFVGVTPGSGYSVTHAAVQGWDLSAATCDNGSPPASIEVDPGQNVTCTFTEQKRGQIVVVVDSVPDDAQDFGFTAGGGLNPASFQLDDDSDPTLANTMTFADVPIGAGYSLSQDALPPGWTQAGVSCSDGSAPSNIGISAGETVTCTYTNNKPGQILVVKDAQPNDAQDFSFTAGGGLSPATFQLDDDADPTLERVFTFSDVTPGSGYSLSESIPSGWVQGSASCDDGSPISNVSVSPGEVVTCTFTNLKRGQIVIVKDAQPNDAQDFTFTASGGLTPTSFQLDDDSDGTLSNTRTFTNIAPGTGYSVSETVPTGWDQGSATCSDGSLASNIGVSAGEVVTCTFTNLKRGQIVIVQNTVPNNGQDFSFTAGGGLSPTSFSLDDDNNPTLSNTRTFTNLQARNGYFVSQTTPAGWGLTSATCSNGSPVSNIVVGAGETVTCTFVDEDAGSLTIVKDAQPNDAQDFAFAVGGGLSPTSFNLDDDSNGTLSNTRVFTDVLAGTYSAAESSVPAGWDLSSATCTDGSPVTAIAISVGEDVTCTFTNQKRGQVVVVKDAQPNDAQDFDFTAGGGLTPASFQLDDDSDGTLSNTRTFSSVTVGSGYSLAEAVPAAWAQSSATCSDGSPVSNINVGPAETVTCTFTNQKRGSITVVKDATPDDAQDFSFTAGGGLSPTSFALDDDTDGTLSNSRAFTGLAPASGYSLSESVPSGWDQTSATCSDGSPVSNINLAPAENVTCTFSNRKRGRIIVVKDATPDDPQDFSFTAGGGLSPTSFALDDDGNATLSNTRTFNDVVPASGYSLAETVPSGWDQTGATCDDGSSPSNISVSANETVTCTFSNRKRATLVVVKDAQPNDPQDFSFTAGGGLSPTSFALDDDADGALSNSRTFNDVVPGSGYSLAEAVPSGWDQTGAACSDGSPPTNVDLVPGESVTCTFTNRKRGQIVVVKDAQPNDPQDFSFTAGGGLSPTSFALDDDADGALSNSRTFADLVPGSGYSLAETVPSGWDQTGVTCDDGSAPSNIGVSAGEVVTCTFTNDKRGQITIVHDAVPDDAQDFTFTAGGGLSPASFALDDDLDPALSNTRTFSDIAVGSGYSLAETVPSGWDQASAACDDGSPVSNISVSAGEHVTCTFTNNKRGTIVVHKNSTPNDPQDFAFTVSGGLSPASFALDDDANPTLSSSQTLGDVPAGSGYAIAETVPSGWDQISATCDDGSAVTNVSVSPGETVNCTFLNRKRGKIIVVKDATPDDPQDFSFTAGGGLSPASFTLDDDSDGTLSNTRTFDNLVIGNYSVSETVPAGWDQTSATCSDGSPVASITVNAGETVTCTFSNSKRAQLTVVKDATPDDAQDFDFTAGGGLSPASFQLDDDADGTLSNTRTFTSVVPGSGYSLSETVPSGWDQTGATCDDGSPVSNVALSAGEQVTCTFANRKRGRIVVVKDARPNDPQDFSFTAGGGLSPASFDLDDDSDGTLSNTFTFTDVVPGSGYSLSETVPSGWDQTGVTCDDGSAPSNIGVSAGEIVTCTFTNDRRGQITVAKDAVPDAAQDFAFTTGGGLTPASIALDDDLDPALSNTHTFGDVPAGSGYSLAETVPSGWDQASATCDDGSPASNISVSAGEHVTCTFTNNKRGTIVVNKNSTPNDPQDFAFTASGGLSPASFALDDDSNPTLSSSQTLGDVPAGSGYAIAETVPTGWDQVSATCDDGSAVTNVSVSPGETVTCTFLNRKRGKIIVTKDATPDDPQDFSFTAGGGLSPASFDLDDDSDGTLSNTRTFDNLVIGNYSVSETVPAGWDQTSATCDDGSPVSNITVNAGETVHCTFSNRKRAQLTVVKDAVPDSAQDFDFTGGGLSPASFQLDDDADGTLSNTHTFTGLVPGSGYSLSETVPGGWNQAAATCDDGSPVSNVALSAGEHVTCTFVNEKLGEIVIVKNSTPNDPQDFDFTAGGGLSPASFSLDDDSDGTLSNTRTFSGVLPGGGYSASESVPAGWDQVNATCSDGSSVNSIQVAPGETVTCTFINRKRGKIIVTKDATPDDPQDFSFTAGGGLSPASFDLDDDSDGTLSNTRTFDNLVIGNYSVSETVPAGWDQTSATCDDGSPVSNITVDAGETVHCTFANRKRGKIVAVKDATPDDPQDFAFTAGGGLSPASFDLDDDSDGTLSNTRTFQNVAPGGGYSLSESVPSGWDQTGASCDDGSPLSDIDVTAGETVTCTFENAKRATLTIVVDATPDDPQDFAFTAGGGLSPASFDLDDDSDGTLSNTRTFTNLPPGSGYSVSGGTPSGWDQTAATCDDGSSLTDITLSVGEHVTCTFANRKRGKVVVLEDATPNDPQDFSFTAGGGLSPASFDLDDDSDGTLSNTRTFDDVVPGSGYSLSQSAPAGWDLASATCDDGSPTSDIVVGAGETVTCTFTHRQHGSITVAKSAQPADGQDFSFTAGGGLSPSSFQLDDDSDGTLSNSRTFSGLSAQAGYSLSESPTAGWDLSSATCDDGSTVTNVVVDPGEHVTCTFTNRKRGQIVVIQDSQPDDAQDFSYTAGGGLSPASFQLDDDSNPTLSNTRTFGDVEARDGYSIAQTLPSGWQLADATCDDGSPVSNVDVGPGETVTCTFTNDKRGRIVVVKDATPDDPQDFSFTAGGGLSPASFDLDDDSDGTLSNTRSFDDLSPGSGYSLSETVPSGWDQTGATCDDGSPVSSISVAAGETVTCTFANRKRGEIVVIKDAIPDDAQNFSFAAGGGLVPSSFQLDDDSDPALESSRTFANVTPGTGYSLSETLPSGWTQVSATCDDGSPVGNIAVAAGERVTCTFVNQHGYPRPKGATPLKASLVPAYTPCTAPNRVHGPSLEFPSCSSPSQTSAQLTVGTPDANGRTATMSGAITFGTILGIVGTPADEADVEITANITDIRRKSDLNDYTGELLGTVTLRITDRLNGPAVNEVGTVSDVPFDFTIPCTATSGGGNIGSTCSVATTADAVLPGTVTETKRTIWAMGDVRVFDGGADGQASTHGDNTLFARQGLLVP